MRTAYRALVVVAALLCIGGGLLSLSRSRYLLALWQLIAMLWAFQAGIWHERFGADPLLAEVMPDTSGAT